MPSTIETLATSETKVGALTREIAKYRYNAAGIQRVVLTNLRELLNGEYDIVDATSPFVMLGIASLRVAPIFLRGITS